MAERTQLAYLIADHRGNLRLRVRRPHSDELSPLEHVFTLRLRIPIPVRRDVTIDLIMPELAEPSEIEELQPDPDIHPDEHPPGCLCDLHVDNTGHSTHRLEELR